MKHLVENYAPCSYSWSRTDGQDIPEEHVAALRRSAEAFIRKGIQSGHYDGDMCHFVDVGDNRVVQYTGGWLTRRVAHNQKVREYALIMRDREFRGEEIIREGGIRGAIVPFVSPMSDRLTFGCFPGKVEAMWTKSECEFLIEMYKRFAPEDAKCIESLKVK